MGTETWRGDLRVALVRLATIGSGAAALAVVAPPLLLLLRLALIVGQIKGRTNKWPILARADLLISAQKSNLAQKHENCGDNAETSHEN